MAHLFVIEGKKVYPNAETLMIPPFKEIWERDKSKSKDVAIKEFAYIEFVSSVKKSNPYRDYPENIRKKKVAEDVVKDKKWQPDRLILQGIDKVDEFQKNASISYTYYLAAKGVIEKMKTFFEELDINERNLKTGMPIWKPKDVTNAVNDTSKTLSTLKDLRSKVEEELFEETRTKSDKQISPFADPESFKTLK